MLQAKHTKKTLAVTHETRDVPFQRKIHHSCNKVRSLIDTPMMHELKVVKVVSVSKHPSREGESTTMFCPSWKKCHAV